MVSQSTPASGYWTKHYTWGDVLQDPNIKQIFDIYKSKANHFRFVGVGRGSIKQHNAFAIFRFTDDWEYGETFHQECLANFHTVKLIHSRAFKVASIHPSFWDLRFWFLHLQSQNGKLEKCYLFFSVAAPNPTAEALQSVLWLWPTELLSHSIKTSPIKPTSSYTFQGVLKREIYPPLYTPWQKLLIQIPPT